MEIALENLYDSSWWLVGARKKYARRIIGLKLLHIRRCASETRYSAIFKTCFPPHNTLNLRRVCWRGGGVRIRHPIALSSAQLAKRSKNFTTTSGLHLSAREDYRPACNSHPLPLFHQTSNEIVVRGLSREAVLFLVVSMSILTILP